MLFSHYLNAKPCCPKQGPPLLAVEWWKVKHLINTFLSNFPLAQPEIGLFFVRIIFSLNNSYLRFPLNLSGSSSCSPQVQLVLSCLPSVHKCSWFYSILLYSLRRKKCFTSLQFLKFLTVIIILLTSKFFWV